MFQTSTLLHYKPYNNDWHITGNKSFWSSAAHVKFDEADQ